MLEDGLQEGTIPIHVRDQDGNIRQLKFRVLGQVVENTVVNRFDLAAGARAADDLHGGILRQPVLGCSLAKEMLLESLQD